jgi:hypothetical protein
MKALSADFAETHSVTPPHLNSASFPHLWRRLMKCLMKSALLGAAVASAQPATAMNLLTNGSLDATTASEIVPGFFLPKPTGWVNVGSRDITGPYNDSMSSEPWSGPAPTPVTAEGSGLPGPDGCGGPDCGVFFKPFSGNTTTNGPATASLYQDIPATPGLSYTLTGWAGAEPNALMAGANIQIEFFDALSNSISSATLDLLATLYVDNGQPFDYKQYSVSAVAPATAVTVRSSVSMIGAIGNPLGGGQAFVVDDFSLTAVPEPTSVVMAAGAMLALAARRRVG